MNRAPQLNGMYYREPTKLSGYCHRIVTTRASQSQWPGGWNEVVILEGQKRGLHGERSGAQ
jgi:hypothetical protein